MLVTDVERIKNKKTGEKTFGFYMDGYLAQNLALIPRYLKAAWDCVGIVSGWPAATMCSTG